MVLNSTGHLAKIVSAHLKRATRLYNREFVFHSIGRVCSSFQCIVLGALGHARHQADRKLLNLACLPLGFASLPIVADRTCNC